MIYHILGVFNKRIDAYGSPLFTKEAVEDYTIQFTRSLKLADEQVKHNYESTELVHLGDLDDVTGDFVSVKKVLISLDGLLNIEE